MCLSFILFFFIFFSFYLTPSGFHRQVSTVHTFFSISSSISSNCCCTPPASHSGEIPAPSALNPTPGATFSYPRRLLVHSGLLVAHTAECSCSYHFRTNDGGMVDAADIVATEDNGDGTWMHH
jgi:hypothetical protein